MIQLHKNIYHYTSAETLIDHILPTQKIILRQLKHMNDPRESKEWPLRFYALTQSGYENFDSNLFDYCSKYITETTNVLSTVIDSPKISDEDIIDDVSQTGFGHPRMWAQYAKNHTGVCLVIDKTKFQKEMENSFGKNNVFHGMINYLETPIGFNQEAYTISDLEAFLKKGVEESLDSHIKKHYSEFFFTKHKDWRDENEYRWIFKGENLNNSVYVSIKESLVGIIFGDSISEDHRKK